MKLFWFIAQTIGAFSGTFLLTYSLIVLPSQLNSPSNSVPDEVTSLPTPNTEQKESPDSFSDEATNLPTPKIESQESPYFPSNETTSLSTLKLKDWEELISFRPPSFIQKETLKYKLMKPLPLRGKVPWVNWYIQRIEDTYGPINLDYYAVHISELPTVDGKKLSPTEFLNYIRKNINVFVDFNYAYFEPYNSNWESSWLSNSFKDVIGTYINIDMRTPFNGEFKSVESGAVVVSEITDNKWVFSAVYTRGHRNEALDRGAELNPFTGNRKFSWKPHPSQGYIFYTQGTHRVSAPKLFSGRVYNEQYLFDWRYSFDLSDKLWTSYQALLTKFVNQNGGKAIEINPAKKIVCWDYIKDKYHYPNQNWIDKLEGGEFYPAPSIKPIDATNISCPKFDWQQIAKARIENANNIYEKNKSISAAYAKMYLKNPNFKWAGMAAFASQWVGFGMVNLNTYQASGIDQITDEFGLENRYILTRSESNQLISLLAQGNHGLFMDIYWQHLAFDFGGSQEIIDYAKRTGITLPQKQLEAWQTIEEGIKSGNQEMIWEGNTLLIYHEQTKFLQRLIYDPSLPLWEKLSKMASVNFPGFSKLIASPLPGDSNDFISVMGKNVSIGNKNDRWAWITKTMAPHWKEMETKNKGFTEHWLKTIQNKRTN